MKTKTLKKNIVIYTLLIMIAFPILLNFAIFAILYRTHLKQQKAMLLEMVQHQAALIESIGKFDAMFPDKNLNSSSKIFTLSQIRETQNLSLGKNQPIEIILAEKQDDYIIFLLQNRQRRFIPPPIISLKETTKKALPIKLALKGETGTIIAEDYRGEEVLAAYTYLPFMGLGFVIKIDLIDIIMPFIKGAIFSMFASALFLGICILIYFKTVNPLLKKLVELEQNNQELIHVLCHDLNNNFAVIKMAEELSSPSTPLDSFKTQISHAVQNGIQVIKRVRDMSKSHVKELDLKPVNLSDAVDESIHFVEHMLQNKNLKIIKNIPPVKILADKYSLINSILNNLLSNAIKFSYKNSNIYLNAVEKEKYVIFSIRDSGIGIPPEELQNIFNVNKSTTTLGTGGEKGTGFGLSLVAKFTALFHAKIEVKSIEKRVNPDDHGTEFIITFLKP